MAFVYCSRTCYTTARGKTSTYYRKVNGRHEHRVVAEQMLGRPLRPAEIVHHVDGNRRNNEPSNLEIISQAEHVRRHFAGTHQSSELVAKRVAARAERGRSA